MYVFVFSLIFQNSWIFNPRMLTLDLTHTIANHGYIIPIFQKKAKNIKRKTLFEQIYT